MTRFNWMAGITATLMFAVLSSVGVARAQDTSSVDLVQTACKHGYLTHCGTVTIPTQCSSSWSANLNILLQMGGITYNGQKCAGSEVYHLFKDYDRKKTDFGVCYAYPISRTDATNVSPSDSEGDGIDESSGEC